MFVDVARFDRESQGDVARPEAKNIQKSLNEMKGSSGQGKTSYAEYLVRGYKRGCEKRNKKRRYMACGRVCIRTKSKVDISEMVSVVINVKEDGVKVELGNGERPIKETNKEPKWCNEKDEGQWEEEFESERSKPLGFGGVGFADPQIKSSLNEDTLNSKGWELQSAEKGGDSYYSATAGVLRKGTFQQKIKEKKTVDGFYLV
ncbi:hypothetical protein L1987_18539 [Smallanthus sonchifolius]|uniref:Uncharacterized protein n=1 Tax=Smallanthus sonchifolius TaxID=185202 RepID=A0ACB9IZW0_9ASTR|nr:hypothetical protein L1987_18539 [Smallanthus sonchifolius]